MKSSEFSASFRGISSFGSAFMTLRRFAIAFMCVKAFILHQGDTVELVAD